MQCKLCLISFNSKVCIIFKFISARTFARAFKLLVRFSTTVALYCECEQLKLVHLKLVHYFGTHTMEYFAHFKHSNNLL